MQQYQFDRIFSQMEKEFGRIKKGEEEIYNMMLFPLESNVLKIHRQYPKSNSRRLIEAIGLVLFDIKERCTGKIIDASKFRNEDNGRLERALLMAFDPYTNDEIMKILNADVEAEEVSQWTEETARSYYRIPVMCLLRIKDSADLWMEEYGSDGYFDFIEGYMGSEIRGDQMDFSVVG